MKKPTVADGNLLTELHDVVLERLGDDVSHLTLSRAVLGLFFTGVTLDNGAGGLCATPIKSVAQAVCCPSSAQAMPAPGKLAGRPVRELLDDLWRAQELRRALAIATLNALVETLWRRDGAPTDAECLDGDAFAALALEPGQRVALVGAFPPYMRELSARGQPFHVLELDPSVLKPNELPYYVPADQAPRVVPGADVLIATGTTLLNGSLDPLLGLLREGAAAAVIGPTAPLLTAPYARRGITVVGGTRVVAAEPMLELLAEGGSGHHLFGKSVERVTLRLRRPPAAPLATSLSTDASRAPAARCDARRR